MSSSPSISSPNHPPPPPPLPDHTSPNPSCPFLTLPAELIQRIALHAFPGDPIHAPQNITDLIHFEILSLTCPTIYYALKDPVFREQYYRYTLQTQLGMGRPLDMKAAGRTWVGLGRRVVWEVMEWEGREMTQIRQDGSLARPKNDKRAPPEMFELIYGKAFFKKEKLGKVAKEWDEPIFHKPLTEEQVQGRLISCGSKTLSCDKVFPLSLWGYDQPQFNPRPPAYPASPDTSIGMSYASIPAVQSIKYWVQLGRMELGTFVVRNEDGVTLRDMDRFLDEFLCVTFDSTHMASLKRILPNLALADPNSSMTIREAILPFANPYPVRLPALVNGRTIILFEAWRDEQEEPILWSEDMGNLTALFVEQEEGGEDAAGAQGEQGDGEQVGIGGGDGDKEGEVEEDEGDKEEEEELSALTETLGKEVLSLED